MMKCFVYKLCLFSFLICGVISNLVIFLLIFFFLIFIFLEYVLE